MALVVQKINKREREVEEKAIEVVFKEERDEEEVEETVFHLMIPGKVDNEKALNLSVSVVSEMFKLNKNPCLLEIVEDEEETIKEFKTV